MRMHLAALTLGECQELASCADVCRGPVQHRRSGSAQHNGSITPVASFKDLASASQQAFAQGGAPGQQQGRPVDSPSKLVCHFDFIASTSLHMLACACHSLSRSMLMPARCKPVLLSSVSPAGTREARGWRCSTSAGGTASVRGRSCRPSGQRSAFFWALFHPQHVQWAGRPPGSLLGSCKGTLQLLHPAVTDLCHSLDTIRALHTFNSTRHAQEQSSMHQECTSTCVMLRVMTAAEGGQAGSRGEHFFLRPGAQDVARAWRRYPLSLIHI